MQSVNFIIFRKARKIKALVNAAYLHMHLIYNKFNLTTAFNI